MRACQRVSRFPVPRRFFLVLAWMITAHESRTVALYRESTNTEPAPTSRSFTNEIAALSTSVPDPRSEGNHHMYNQAFILMRCVVAAEEYTMARHALPPIQASSQPAPDFGDALAGAQRSSSATMRSTCRN
jgi:hypothetical protein